MPNTEKSTYTANFEYEMQYIIHQKTTEKYSIKSHHILYEPMRFTSAQM